MTVEEIRTKEVNPKLVKALEDLLVRAKDGELVGFVGNVLFWTQCVDDTWIEPPAWWHTSISCDRLIGSIERLKHKLLTIRTRGETDRYVYFDDDDPEQA